jgi:hypothetical protein
MKFEEGKIYVLKFNSGEEMIAKVTHVWTDSDRITVSNPVSIAPGPKGMQMIPSLLTADQDMGVVVNVSSVAMYTTPDHHIQDSYITATTGIQLPDKQIIMG